MILFKNNKIWRKSRFWQNRFVRKTSRLDATHSDICNSSRDQDICDMNISSMIFACLWLEWTNCEDVCVFSQQAHIRVPCWILTLPNRFPIIWVMYFHFRLWFSHIGLKISNCADFDWNYIFFETIFKQTFFLNVVELFWTYVQKHTFFKCFIRLFVQINGITCSAIDFRACFAEIRRIMLKFVKQT